MADPSKYVTLPVKHEEIWRMYQTTLDWFWTVYDIYMTNDKDNMTKTFDKEQSDYLLKLLSFMFTSHYTTINKELFMQMMNQVEIKEASYFFGSQADAKKTHSMMYSLLLDELTSDEKEKTMLIKDVISMPQVRDFIRWSIQSTVSETKRFAQRLFAFATLQGIIFTVPFLLFKWIKNRHPSMMPGLIKSNDLICRDENLNLKFSCMLFAYIEDELSRDEAHEIVRDAVKHAKNIFTNALPVSILGIECQLIEQFIEHSADRVLIDAGISRLYNKECPFDWAEEPKTDTYQSKMPMNNVVDMSASFGEAKFSTELDF